MKWFDNWIVNRYNALRERNDEFGLKSPIAGNSTVRDRERTGVRKSGIRMSIIPAMGGTAVEFTTYDERKDRHEEHLYVIDDSKELGEELAKIVTVEMMRHG
jgi:hypothetical protein